jgi:hypothetical protein
MKAETIHNGSMSAYLTSSFNRHERKQKAMSQPYFMHYKNNDSYIESMKRQQKELIEFKNDDHLDPFAIALLRCITDDDFSDLKYFKAQTNH